jgi:pyrimidine-nucleoside phosphorylase
VAARITDLIARKRDGEELSAAEIAAMVGSDVPDYQLSAFLMAVVLRGMSDDETRGLLDATVASGQRVSWPWPVADKHSTGGVGDSTTLVLAPLLAACGVLVAKMSGRGLGHTGGTLDKLEAIPGMRVSLSLAGMRRQVEQVGVAVCGQTPELAPADGRLYALRDATATVSSMPLIAASIMSKKVAAGASRLLLDVKVGEGSLLPDADASRELAGLMVRLGRGHDIDTRALLSNMSEPLGAAVGDALEVAEAVDTLRGEGPSDITELCVHQATVLAGDESVVRRALDSGAAYERYQRWVVAQGGDPEAPLPRAPLVVEVLAPRSGVVQRCHARGIGEQVMRLGAGRATKEDIVDHAVGVLVHRKRGDRVEAGEPLATVHARREADLDAVAACFEIGDAPVERGSLLLGDIDA